MEDIGADLEKYLFAKKLGGDVELLDITVIEIMRWVVRPYKWDASSPDDGVEYEKIHSKTMDRLKMVIEYYDDEIVFPDQRSIRIVVDMIICRVPSNAADLLIFEMMEILKNPDDVTLSHIANYCMEKGHIAKISKLVEKHNAKLYLRNVDKEELAYYVKRRLPGEQLLVPSFVFQH